MPTNLAILRPLAPAPDANIATGMAVRARSSAGEHFLDMEGVTGSIPVAPTIFAENSHTLEQSSETALQSPARKLF
jgi:hypothetical protein